MRSIKMDALLDDVAELHDDEIAQAYKDGYEIGFEEGKKDGFLTGYEEAMKDNNPT